ncbi:MAG: YcxB family protein [Kiritimatiellaeota bacterium]|nr:YcxB family protein [Kiritimatiellota bacterium]
MEVNVTVNQHLNEYMRFNFYHGQKTVMIWLPLMCLAGFCICHTLCGALIVGGLWLLPVFLITFLRTRRAWKTNALRGVSADYTFSDAGFRSESEAGTFNCGYDKLFKVCESKAAFYVYLSSLQAIIVPKRCFENTDDIRVLREIFVRNMDKKKLRLRRQDD